ncbi:hypothetical protein SAICODRAFT_19251 [Saitoella complicata NRRL Y-17804]|uniref:Uncharacterized protein n=1 Tax=Saitoella complicata (strain BCRC 22490 / CBS 7301 / JCM 7358 / NBRC 10748 / NRRL Y-17804) TaxID=698492 RepID=A0A0E9NFN5_SAICN|nr:uncharacterized protein SAICODRAFT_19251 [Saitoella complicata NRRL Y-17804]ODQ52880.1 hypothetical protein SAICODRAFT_19251 [Saitoella complicata NRRL Y-17804]GAO48496.1 hypothetical protein G7K_2669-t1 [Saitoella complicata NRRL Y-17804]
MGLPMYRSPSPEGSPEPKRTRLDERVNEEINGTSGVRRSPYGSYSDALRHGQTMIRSRSSSRDARRRTPSTSAIHDREGRVVYTREQSRMYERWMSDEHRRLVSRDSPDAEVLEGALSIVNDNNRLRGWDHRLTEEDAARVANMRPSERFDTMIRAARIVSERRALRGLTSSGLLPISPADRAEQHDAIADMLSEMEPSPRETADIEELRAGIRRQRESLQNIETRLREERAARRVLLAPARRPTPPFVTAASYDSGAQAEHRTTFSFSFSQSERGVNAEFEADDGTSPTPNIPDPGPEHEPIPAAANVYNPPRILLSPVPFFRLFSSIHHLRRQHRDPTIGTRAFTLFWRLIQDVNVMSGRTPIQRALAEELCDSLNEIEGLEGEVRAEVLALIADRVEVGCLDGPETERLESEEVLPGIALVGL